MWARAESGELMSLAVDSYLNSERRMETILVATVGHQHPNGYVQTVYPHHSPHQASFN